MERGKTSNETKSPIATPKVKPKLEEINGNEESLKQNGNIARAYSSYILALKDLEFPLEEQELRSLHLKHFKICLSNFIDLNSSYHIDDVKKYLKCLADLLNEYFEIIRKKNYSASSRLNVRLLRKLSEPIKKKVEKHDFQKIEDFEKEVDSQVNQIYRTQGKTASIEQDWNNWKATEYSELLSQVTSHVYSLELNQLEETFSKYFQSPSLSSKSPSSRLNSINSSSGSFNPDRIRNEFQQQMLEKQFNSMLDEIQKSGQSSKDKKIAEINTQSQPAIQDPNNANLLDLIELMFGLRDPPPPSQPPQSNPLPPQQNNNNNNDNNNLPPENEAPPPPENNQNPPEDEEDEDQSPPPENQKPPPPQEKEPNIPPPQEEQEEKEEEQPPPPPKNDFLNSEREQNLVDYYLPGSSKRNVGTIFTNTTLILNTDHIKDYEQGKQNSDLKIEIFEEFADDDPILWSFENSLKVDPSLFNNPTLQPHLSEKCPETFPGDKIPGFYLIDRIRNSVWNVAEQIQVEFFVDISGSTFGEKKEVFVPFVKQVFSALQCCDVSCRFFCYGDHIIDETNPEVSNDVPYINMNFDFQGTHLIEAIQSVAKIVSKSKSKLFHIFFIITDELNPKWVEQCKQLATKNKNQIFFDIVFVTNEYFEFGKSSQLAVSLIENPKKDENLRPYYKKLVDTVAERFTIRGKWISGDFSLEQLIGRVASFRYHQEEKLNVTKEKTELSILLKKKANLIQSMNWDLPPHTMGIPKNSPPYLSTTSETITKFLLLTQSNQSEEDIEDFFEKATIHFDSNLRFEREIDKEVPFEVQDQARAAWNEFLAKHQTSVISLTNCFQTYVFNQVERRHWNKSDKGTRIYLEGWWRSLFDPQYTKVFLKKASQDVTTYNISIILDTSASMQYKGGKLRQAIAVSLLCALEKLKLITHTRVFAFKKTLTLLKDYGQSLDPKVKATILQNLSFGGVCSASPSAALIEIFKLMKETKDSSDSSGAIFYITDGYSIVDNLYNEVTLAEKQNIRLVGVGLTGDDVSRKFYHFIEVTSLNHLDKGFKDLFNNFPLGVQCLPGSIPKGEVPILDLKIPYELKQEYPSYTLDINISIIVDTWDRMCPHNAVIGDILKSLKEWANQNELKSINPHLNFNLQFSVWLNKLNILEGENFSNAFIKRLEDYLETHQLTLPSDNVPHYFTNELLPTFKTILQTFQKKSAPKQPNHFPFHIVMVLSNSLFGSKNMEDLYGEDAWKFDFFQEENNAKEILKSLNQHIPSCFVFFHQETPQENLITPRQVMNASLKSWGLKVKDIYFPAFQGLVDIVSQSVSEVIKTELL